SLDPRRGSGHRHQAHRRARQLLASGALELMAWILDLDGVLWLSDVAIPGSADAIARLRARGDRVLFVSNNSSARVDDYLGKLERVGVPTESDDLVTSAQAAATLLQPGET